MDSRFDANNRITRCKKADIMDILSFQETSLIDMPGCVSCVVYTQGCNRRCEYCHNPESIPTTAGKVPWKDVLLYLTRRQGLIDAIVFSGGEPTLQKDLVEKIYFSKHLGFNIGLHTNGEGIAFKQAAPLCDYILLSHSTPEKIVVAKQARSVQLSEVVWLDGGWENKITDV